MLLPLVELLLLIEVSFPSQLLTVVVDLLQLPHVSIAAPPLSPTIAASAKAVVSAAGTISEIRIVNAGAGFLGSAPAVTIGSAATTGIGTYWFNEVITGSRSGMSGRVKRWDADTNILRVGLTSGYFFAGETLTGAKSGAAYVIKNPGVASTETDKYRDNDEFETQADSLIDFSETNPFGTY